MHISDAYPETCLEYRCLMQAVAVEVEDVRSFPGFSEFFRLLLRTIPVLTPSGMVRCVPWHWNWCSSVEEGGNETQGRRRIQRMQRSSDYFLHRILFQQEAAQQHTEKARMLRAGLWGRGGCFTVRILQLFP